MTTPEQSIKERVDRIITEEGQYLLGLGYDFSPLSGRLLALLDQISAERAEKVVTKFAANGYVIHWKSCEKAQHNGPECTCGLDEAILAVFKGLPAVQQEAEDGEPTEETTIYTRNDLRRQILAELGEQDR